MRSVNVVVAFNEFDYNAHTRANYTRTFSVNGP